MYFWNFKSLAKDLSRDCVSEKDGMLYFLVSSLLILFATYYSLWWGVFRNWLFYFELIVLSIITIFGCIKAFEENGGNEGKLFVFRALCLSVPIGVRLNVFSIVFGLILQLNVDRIFMGGAFANPQFAYNIVGYACFVTFSIYFWYLLIQGLKLTRSYDQKT